MKCGYARVSTDRRSVDAQVRQLTKPDCKTVPQGVASGAKSDRNPWAETTTPHDRLMLTVLGGLAGFERDLIRARTAEGRSRAVARGVKLGRKPKLTPHQIL